MKMVELRRHTASDGDALTAEGIQTAVEIGGRLADHYDLLVSSGAQRATQTLACFLAGAGKRFPSGVTVDPAFRSSVEERWFTAARQSGGGGLDAFLRVDRTLVDAEAARFAGALRRVFDSLPEGGRALVVGHSPMHEVAVYGLTGVIVPSISKGAGLLLRSDGARVWVAAGPAVELRESVTAQPHG
jgi:broad specificity phosphatase PhoE